MITFTKEAWKHYQYWQSAERKIIERINMLIRDILRDPFHGLGKPEPLKGKLSGFWPRRIDDEIGKPCAGKPQARFDEGGLIKSVMVRLFRHCQTKGAETDKPA